MTQLKESVDNPNLPKFGYQNFYSIDNQTIRQVNSYTPADGLLSYRFKANIVSGNSYFTIGTDTTHHQSVDVTGQNGWDTYVELHKAQEEDANYEIDVRSSSCVFGVLNLANINPSYNVYIVSCRGGYKADGSYVQSSGSIDSISEKYPNICEFEAQWQSAINGNLVTGFGNAKYILYLALRSTQIEGSIEELCNALVSSGRTNGFLGIICNGRITYQGSAVQDGTQKNIRFGSSMENPTADETTQGWQITT